ncbi:MAG: response regulator [Clostridiales Family XIII bacterium]|jgi:DNA-binding NarL/FixJ family response regulator|nr:response regulator [Clostridiales Family XIII bacterium]
MDSILQVLLIEDDQSACDNFIQYINGIEDISLVAYANDATEAIKLVQRHLPHVIILDLELQQGGGNGLIFLQELGRLDLQIAPYILVTTHNSSSVTLDLARELGADFIMTKYQTDYSAKMVVEFLKLVKNNILQKSNHQESSTNLEESPAQKVKRLTKMVCIEFDHIGVSTKLTGYKYLIDAVLINMENSNARISTEIAAKYNKSTASVERAMEAAINKTWNSADIDDLSKYYTARIRPDRGQPTLLEFITYYANKIENMT